MKYNPIHSLAVSLQSLPWMRTNLSELKGCCCVQLLIWRWYTPNVNVVQTTSVHSSASWKKQLTHRTINKEVRKIVILLLLFYVKKIHSIVSSSVFSAKTRIETHRLIFFRFNNHLSAWTQFSPNIKGENVVLYITNSILVYYQESRVYDM